MTETTNETTTLDLASLGIAESKRRDLLSLFPEVGTEGGKIDFDRLRLALGETVDVGCERYGMTWPGKADCFRAIQSPSVGTLRPCPEESVDFDTTENLIFEGGAPKDADALARQLALHVRRVRDGRTDFDLLYGILLASGFPLTTPVERLTLAGKSIYSADDGALLVCLEREPTLELIRELAARKPERVVFLDEGFDGQDQLKANAVRTFQSNDAVVRTV